MLVAGGVLTLSFFALKLVAADEDAKPATEAKAEERKDAVSTPEVKEGSAEEKAEASKKDEGVFPDKEFYTKAEVQALRSVLDEKSAKLERDMEAQKKYLESLKSQVSEQLRQIEAAQNEIADYMNARDEKEEGKLKKLAKFYEAMDPEQAAPLMKEISDELAIKIFDRMDVKKAGSILAQIPNARAARITSAFPKLKLQADTGGEKNQ